MLLQSFLPETKQLLERLESLSERRVEFVRRDDLSVLATLQIARNGATAHLLHYRPSKEPIDYVVCHQVGIVLRMFELPDNERMDFASDNRGEKVLQEMLSASGSLSKTDKELLPAFSKMLNGWALMQIRSIPIGMRVDAWLQASFPKLREQIAQGIAIQQQMNADILSQRVGNLTVPPIQLAPPAAYALFADRSLGTGRYSIPFEAAGALADGKILLTLFDTIPDDPSHDRQLVDAWAEELGMAGWYKWILYKP